MELTKDEEKMLSGGYGEGYKRALEILVRMGEFYDAKRLVPISMAYLVEGPNPAKRGQPQNGSTTWPTRHDLQMPPAPRASRFVDFFRL